MPCKADVQGMNKLRAYISWQAFNPGFLGLFINPFYFARRGLYEHIKADAKHAEGRLLDVGCGSKPYRHLFKSTDYDGLEIERREGDEAEYHYDGRTFPFQDGTYDSIFCSQVLEHVFEPDAFVGEIGRVLKPGGILLLTVPFAWDEHEQPYDYARYSSFGLRHLLKRHGFEIVKHDKSMADIRAVAQLYGAYIYKITRSSNAFLNFMTTLCLIAPCTVLAECLRHILPGNPDFYLDNIIVARKMGGS